MFKISGIGQIFLIIYRSSSISSVIKSAFVYCNEKNTLIINFLIRFCIAVRISDIWGHIKLTKQQTSSNKTKSCFLHADAKLRSLPEVIQMYIFTSLHCRHLFTTTHRPLLLLISHYIPLSVMVATYIHFMWIAH